ncbi:hypothetical protein CCP2SC5_610003 [Azospirillaceae bacterium]
MNSETPTILIVDDDHISLLILENFFKKKYNIYLMNNGNDAIRFFENNYADIVLLDMVMPKMKGIEVCKALKSNEKTKGIPIIFIISSYEIDEKVAGFSAGCVDYITKPFVKEEVISRVNAHINLHRHQKYLEKKILERTNLLFEEVGKRNDAEFRAHKLSTVINQCPLSIIIVNTQGYIEYVNPMFETVSGYSAEEIIGKNPRFLKSGYTTNDEYKGMWDTITNGGVWRGEFCDIRKDGHQFWESVIIAPVLSETGEIVNFVGIKEDITEKKKRDNELLSAKVRAESASMAKSQFLTMISHELRTPLNAVIGFSEILSMELSNSHNERGYEYARYIYSEGRHLLDIIGQILDITMIESGKFKMNNELFSIQNIIYDAKKIALLTREASCKNASINIGESIPLVKGDPGIIRQVFINIIGNSCKFTPPDGKIEINIKMSIQEYMEIIVSDNGFGISSDHLNKILEPFEQAENIMTRKHEGLGLGLPLAKLMIECHGGTLKLESRQGEGTMVIIRLPKECLVHI